MRALFEMTDGRNRLKSILASRPSDSSEWNEAQNRFQFIDRLMTECLGWEKPNILVEQYDEGGGRSDYILGKPAKAVLEAKREANIWQVLPSGATGKVRKLRPLIDKCPKFKEAVVQVIPYCTFKGTPIAAVCNGPQLAIFQSITIGMEPLDGECYLFNGFESYVEEFPLLWTLMSPEGITENRAFRDLSKHRNPRVPPKASTVIPEPNKYRYRSPLQDELKTLGSLLLEEIEDNPELKPQFYAECYVPLEANNRHLLLSKQIIGSRYKRVGGDNVAPASIDNITSATDLTDAANSEASSRPVVVIGDVGVGKTSFFENFYQNLTEKDKEDTLFVNINLGTRAALSSTVKDFILLEIPDTLRRQYGINIFSSDFANTIYYKEIADFDDGVEGQLKDIDEGEYKKAKIKFLRERIDRSDAHLKAALAHLRYGQGKRIILIIDNADQRSFEVQQEAFLIAQELAATRLMFVFVALRPSTFYLSKATGILSAYQNKVLTISPPPADEVVSRRLTFALRVAEGKAAPATLERIRLNLGNIVLFLKATLRSVRTNDKIRQFLSNISGGNTRSVIELITSFCGSPNVDAGKIVEIEERAGNYVVPLHEFTKHALLGEFSYYNPQSSLFAYNIFDVATADAREHFLACLIIAYIASNLGKRDNDGFVLGVSIADEMRRHGFLDEQIEACLIRLATRRLIETPHAHFREVPVESTDKAQGFHFRATSIGLYHSRFWAGSFSFLDATSIDTPIFDEAARSDVCALAVSYDIVDRLKKAKIFRDYLEARWHLASFDAPYYDFTAVLAAGGEEFELVENVVKRSKRRRGWIKSFTREK